MSTNNLARVYWAELEKAKTIFEKGHPEGAGEICLQLCNDFTCPRYVNHAQAHEFAYDVLPANSVSSRRCLMVAVQVLMGDFDGCVGISPVNSGLPLSIILW